MSTTYGIPCWHLCATLKLAFLSCHFSLDVLCDKTSSSPVVTDPVSVSNWPPLPPQLVATESDDFILGVSREEDLDG